ncbi:Transposase [Caenorhabditis elegans]|uniref:Transposase n=1 Tax=Caenorhabditis elegans TaxID=6239 RepID=H2L2H1_CAEEL|nr:Transposase [Caenorhabditis elegans]CCE71322.1 Transposase [Caenorhabditis elegans]|eukprot:NP_001251187.1 Uncharacterized protein CELE_C04F12.16 [Caenorhabditis elegans]
MPPTRCSTNYLEKTTSIKEFHLRQMMNQIEPGIERTYGRWTKWDGSIANGWMAVLSKAFQLELWM